MKMEQNDSHFETFSPVDERIIPIFILWQPSALAIVFGFDP
jgi:hypothetical protein